MVRDSGGSSCVCEPNYREFLHVNGWWGHEFTCVAEAEYEQLEIYYSSVALTVEYQDLSEEQGSQLSVAGSKIMQQLLLPSAVDCLIAVAADTTLPRAQPVLEGNQACQALGNLCVLNDYEERSTSCTLYRQLQSTAGAASISLVGLLNTQWRPRMPGLYYDDRGVSPLTATAPPVDTLVALPPAPGSRMRYVLAPYSMNGTFLGLQELKTQMQLCSGGAQKPTGYLNFGTSMSITCEVPPSELLAVAEPTFYDLYYYYDEGASANAALIPDLDSGFLYPVPVRLMNYRVDGQKVNDNVNLEGKLLPFDDQLTRRFFTVDAASSVTTYGEMPRVVRYIKKATLAVELRSPDESVGYYDTNQILPPVLDIEYAEVAIPTSATSPLSAETLLAEQEVVVVSTFAAVYSMSTADSTMTILFIFALGVWLLLTLIKGGMLFRRNHSATMDGYMMFRLLAATSDGFALVFFVLLLSISVWWLIAFKGQTELYVLMPRELPPMLFLGIMPFEVFIACAFSAKCLHILDILQVQTKHDLFFLDWEQPRSLRSDGGDEEDDPKGRGEAGDGKSALPVSVWRTIFVANEWVKLQDVRAISMEINLIALLFLLRGAGLEDFARLVPHGPGEAGVPFHTLLRFALTSSLLIALSLTQWLFRWAFWERYVKDRIWQFVDLLAVTNVSCLLLEERHFGFYLHGRSVHDHADADMAQLNANLKREEEGLEMLRGFRQDSTVQTFEVYISPTVRQKYDAAFAGGLDGNNRARSGTRRRGGRGPEGAVANNRRRGFRAAPEEGVQRHRELNRFLMTYLGTPTGGSDSGGASEGRPDVRRKRYWEQLIGLPPDALASYNRSIFLEDTAGRFKRLLLAGREADMMLFGVLTYALFDMTTENTFVAIFATYAMDVAVRKLRAELAARNIAAKTLLDDRFLL